MGQRYYGYPGSSPDETHVPITLQSLDNQQLYQAERDRRVQSPDTPLRFAVGQSLEIGYTESAAWEMTDDGMLVGKLKIQSKTAHSLNFHFSEFDLPAQTQLSIYNPLTGQSLRQFTQVDMEAHRQLWTPLIFGDVIMLEVVTTEQALDAVQITLQSVYHDFVGFNNAFERISGECNLDVICGQADGYSDVDLYRQQISSVGAYHFNGQEICSGVAVNNSRRDCTPYFLTANHCGVTEATALSMIVYWNYENSYCRQPHSPESGQAGDGQLNQYNVGAHFKAKDVLSDFALVELDDPIDPRYNVYLSGWDKSDALPSRTIAIHHPGVEEKRISIDYDAPQIDYSSSGQGKRIRVNDWDIGTTEGGSSGCPLYNSDGLIIGQLVGGTASCSNNEWDVFGWFHKSWDAGNSPQTSLKSWLDPDGISADQLTGHNCSYMLDYDPDDSKVCNSQQENSHEIVITANAAFSETAMLDIIDDGGLDVSLLVTQIDHNSSATLRINELQSVSIGDYTVKLKGNNSQVDLYLDVNLNVVDQAPTQPMLILPVDELSGVSDDILLEWSAVPATLYYEVKVGNDTDLTLGQIDYTHVTDPDLLVSDLKPNSIYYWKVRAVNACGTSEWSDTYLFETGFEFCTRIVNTVSQEIDDTANTYYYPLDCTHDVNIKSLQIDNIRGTHEYISDLYFWVKKGLQQVFLWGGGCGSSQDYSIGFSIDRPATASCPITDGKIYKPAQTYQGLLDTEAKGLWQIRVEDKEVQDGGTIEQAMLTICFDEVYGDALVPSSNVIFVCDEEIEFDLYSNVTHNGELSLTMHNSDQQEIPYTTSASNQSASHGIYKMKVNKSDIIGSDNILLKASSSTGEITTHITLVSGEDAEVNPIVFPQYNHVTSTDIILQFEVMTTPILGTELQISLDPNFSEIIYSADFGAASIMEVDYHWEPETQYYARTLNSAAFKDCRGISETITFFGGAISKTHEEAPLPSVMIAPNPASHDVMIRLQQSRSSFDYLSLYTPDGHLVYDQSYDDSQTTQTVVDVSHLPKGLYIVSLQLKDHTYVIDKLSVH